MQRAFSSAQILAFVFLTVTAFFLCPLVCLAAGRTGAPAIAGTTWFNTGTQDHLSLRSFSGKVVIVFFWASQDEASEKGISFLNDQYERFRSKGLEVIGVYCPVWTFDFSESRLFRDMEKMGIKFPVVVDNKATIKAAYGQEVSPTVYFIDRRGFIRGKKEGVIQDGDFDKILKILLEEA